jgi:hypothetical protein
MKKFLLPTALFALAVCAYAQGETKNSKNLPKLSADEIIAKHLASIGSESTRNAIKSRVMIGVGAFTTKVNPGRVGGAAQFATAGQSLLLAIVINSSDYPFEKFAFDGKDATFGVMPSGGYSPLGSLLKTNKTIFRRGFLGGVLSQGWPLLQTSREVRFESGGIASAGERDLYKLKVTGAGSGDIAIALYFEPETFHHVRTEYTYRSGQLTTPNPNRPMIGGAGVTAPESYKLTEDFSNFKKVDDLVLPLTYTIELTPSSGRSLIWTSNFSQVFNNQEIDPSSFRIS